MVRMVCAMCAFHTFASIHFFAVFGIVLVVVAAVSARVRYCFDCWLLMQNIFDSRIVC